MSAAPTVTRDEEPIFTSSYFDALKDPCSVFDGSVWHLYGTGSGTRRAWDVWRIVHATAPELQGLWTERVPVRSGGAHGTCVAAPGVIYDEGEGVFHLYIQIDCLELDGDLLHFSSKDGNRFLMRRPALHSRPNTEEAGIYDSHPAIFHGQKYLTYSAMRTIRRSGKAGLHFASMERSRSVQ